MGTRRSRSRLSRFKPFVATDDCGSQHDAGHGLVAFCLWLYWTISEVGVWGFLVHTFGPKGGLKGVIGDYLPLCGSYRGGLHLGSTCLPLTATFRERFCRGDSALLNDHSGHAGLSGCHHLSDEYHRPIPFYFLELLVGLLQALVFTLLCAVYIQLSTTHDEEEEH